MKTDSMIEELLAHARRLVGLPVHGKQSAEAALPRPAGHSESVEVHGTHPSALGSPRERSLTIDSSPVRVRVYSPLRDEATATSEQPQYGEVLLPAINGCGPQRVMLSRDHWMLLAKVLQQTRKGASIQPRQAKQPVELSAAGAASHAAPGPAPSIAAVTVGGGERLYLLPHDKLYGWAQTHWESLNELESVCDAFFNNWKAWRLAHPRDWSLADHFFACQERLNTLRRRVEAQQDEPDTETAPITGRQPNDTTASADTANKSVLYARLLEDVLISWNDRDALTTHAETLRQMLRQGMPSLSAELRPPRILELIEMRLHAMLPAIPIVPAGPAAAVVREPKKLASARRARARGLPPGCPEWPAEAHPDAAAALNSEKFIHATGMLKVMGYGVGKKSAVSVDRRLAILSYVFMGRLPPVNDTHYMQEWGRPRSNRRLRKIANSLATFARNARRKKSGSWDQAITNWEADLAYLKKRYYNKRARDWKWPEAVRKRTG